MKVKIKDMLTFYSTRAVRTNGKAAIPPPDYQAGYVMGGDGRIATDDYIRARAMSSYKNAWAAYYEAYKKWIGHEVYDCNALAEAYYKKATGQSIDTKAKYNFSGWCGVRSGDTADPTLTGLPQMPGVALFSGGNTADSISHVGFLFEKYGSGNLDWYVLECRGKDYGLVITTLTERSWAFWGVMDKYFDYEENESEVIQMATKLKITSPLMRSDAICELQEALNRLGYDCGEPDGICGKQTIAGVEAFCTAHDKNSLPDTATATVIINGTKLIGTIKKE